MVQSWKRGAAVLAIVAVVASACGGSSSDDASPQTAEGEQTSTTVAEVTTTASTTTTTAAPTTTAETTTQPPPTTKATTTVPDESGDVAIADYCTALDEIDAFFESDFPDDADLQAAIDEQQANIAAIVVPSETLESAHESYSGALLEFFDTFESNGFDISDDEVIEIFEGIDVRLAEGIVELYRENNCDGFEAADDEESVVRLTGFEFVPGTCVNQNGDNYDELACDEPHDYQVYSTFLYDEGDDFPGATEVKDKADTHCLDEFEPFVGVSFQSSIYFVTTLRPSSGTWLQGDREIVCLLQAETGQLSKDLEGVAE